MKSTIVLLVLALSVVACDQSKEAPTEATEPAAAEAAPTESKDSKTVEGKIAFSVDGEKKSFTHMPAEQNMAMSVSTMMLARPEAGATEEFSIVVMNFNGKKAELPATLKLDMKKAMAEKGDPMKFAKAPKPIVEYKSAEGVMYRGYAEIVFESNDGGVITGKVTDMELGTVKPADKEKPPVKLSGLTFEVAL